MAASKPLIDEIVNELDCVVCLEQKRLHLFPCSHRCCQECIGNLAGDDGTFPCPICRRDIIVPEEGFPVCLLSEYLREKLSIGLSHAQGISSKCKSCNVKPVVARCRQCLMFICYSCDKRGICEAASNKKHDSDDLEEIAGVASSQLDGWKAKTKREIMALEEVVRQKQREIQDKKNVLQACENIEKQSDSAEKITLIEQICNVQIIPSSIDTLPKNFKGLRFISLHSTGYQCTSFAHVGDDKLAIGCSIGLKLFNKTTAEMKLAAKLRAAVVTEYNDEIFLSYTKEGKAMVARYDSSGAVDLFSFTQVSAQRCCVITVNQDYVAVIEMATNSIKLYNRRTQVVLTKDLPGIGQVCVAQFYTDGSLIIPGIHNSVIKYKLPDNPAKDFVMVWTVKLDTPVVGLAVSDIGTIFVAGFKSKQIYILSKEGEQLSTVKHDRLPGECIGISIRGGELAVAGMNDNNFLLFNIV